MATMREIRDDLNRKTRRFPFGLKVLIADDQSAPKSYFPKIQAYLQETKGWTASAEQYVNFYRDPELDRNLKLLTVGPGRCPALFRAIHVQH
jgi:hypothetical protein